MIESGICAALVRGGEGAWRASSTPGISFKVLRADKETGESTVLLRFDTGARFPAHNHPGGEQIFILECDLQVGRDRLKAGDYLYTPPGDKHAVSTEGGCLLLATGLRPIEILKP